VGGKSIAAKHVARKMVSKSSTNAWSNWVAKRDRTVHWSHKNASIQNIYVKGARA
jgi:hypothetical protein